MKRWFPFLIVSLCVLLGCATPYQPLSFRGGYSETALAPDLFRVHFRANGQTSPEQARDFALLRASELTIQNGFTCFEIVLDRSTVLTGDSFLPPPKPYLNPFGGPYSDFSNSYPNPYGGKYSDIWKKMFVPQDIMSMGYYHRPLTNSVSKPQTEFLIKTFRATPEGVVTFDAMFLQNSLRQKYGVE